MKATELKEKSVEELNAELINCYANSSTCACSTQQASLKKLTS